VSRLNSFIPLLSIHFLPRKWLNISVDDMLVIAGSRGRFLNRLHALEIVTSDFLLLQAKQEIELISKAQDIMYYRIFTMCRVIFNDSSTKSGFPYRRFRRRRDEDEF
jgi:hypothetical protein